MDKDKHMRNKKGSLTVKQKKQLFRDKKYKKSLGTKKEGQGFASQSKQKAVYQYRKLLRKEEARAKYNKSKAKDLLKDADDIPGPMSKGQKKFNSLQKAEKLYKKQQAEKLQLKKEIAAKKRQQKEALKKYQTDKKEKFKLLCKKNFRGQPKVAGQMEILLSKIEASQKEG